VDIDEETVQQLNAGYAPLLEPHLQDYIDEAGDDLRATTEIEEAVEETDITYIVVNTPSTEDGRYSLQYVEEVCHSIADTLANKDEYHVVVLTSTVFPGSTMGEVRMWLEEGSEKTAGEDFGICYSPEFIALGDVIRGLENPDFFLLGEQTEQAGDMVAEIYNELANKDSPIARMTPTEAEVAKMAVNSFVTM